MSLRFGQHQLDRRHDEEHAREHGEAGEPVALTEKTVHGARLAGSGAFADQSMVLPARLKPATPTTTSAIEASLMRVSGSRK